VCQEASIRRLDKPATGELSGETPGAPDRDAQYRCMPVVSDAGNWLKPLTYNQSERRRHFGAGRDGVPFEE